MKIKKTKNIRQLNIRNIVIARGCRTVLKKIKESFWGNILDAIECGNWWIPSESYEYVDIKDKLETEVFHDFFKLPENIVIKIKSFDTDILSFDKGR